MVIQFQSTPCRLLKRVVVLLATMLISVVSMGRLHPGENMRLHYRIIGFTFPSPDSATGSEVEIARGYHYNDDSFLRYRIISLPCITDRVMGEVPDFDAPYTWRVTSQLKDGSVKKGELHHFSTGISPKADTGIYRLVVTGSAQNFADAFVFTDANGVLYNMQGKPVWFLPRLPGINNDNISIRDMKVTQQGTITLLIGSTALEIDYDGNILFRGPDRGEVSREATEHYHHEFTRLPNGHYMMMGNEMLPCMANADSTLMPVIAVNNDGVPTEATNKLAFTTLIEYDEAGRLVWNWRASEFYRNATVYKHMKKSKSNLMDLHENSFSFDTKANAIYISLRNTSQVLKVAYPSGNVTNIFGNTGQPATKLLFCMQHACKSSGNGSLYLFNNNDCTKAEPGIIIMKEPVTAGGRLKKTWEYVLPSKFLADSGVNAKGRAGGNVTELPGGAMFVSMCEPYSNLFIVSKDKKLLWHSVFQHRDSPTAPWQKATQYRANIINSKGAFEAIVWHNYGTK